MSKENVLKLFSKAELLRNEERQSKGAMRAVSTIKGELNKKVGASVNLRGATTPGFP